SGTYCKDGSCSSKNKEDLNSCNSEGEIRCITTSAYQICQKDNKGFLKWSSQQKVSQGMICKDDKFICSSYNSCNSEGEIRCITTSAYQICQKDNTGCLKWSSQQKVSQGMICKEGLLSCSYEGETRCMDKKNMQTCIKNSKGNLTWSSIQTCKETEECISNKCVDRCNNIICEDTTIKCPDGTTASCTNTCDSNTGKCSKCIPDCKDKCKGKICPDTKVLCLSDCSIANCKNTCDPSTGQCSFCIPKCNSYNRTIKCIISDGCTSIEKIEEEPCPLLKCDSLDLCQGKDCGETKILCPDGTYSICKNTCNPLTGSCEKCTPNKCENKCENVVCSASTIQCFDGTTSSCTNTCDPKTGLCTSCTPVNTCKDLCLNVKCNNSEIKCPDGSISSCQNTCDPKTGLCTSCTPEPCKDLCQGKDCGETKILCPDGTYSICKNTCNPLTGSCEKCTPNKC
ncbi:MAG: hypothetical protein QW117_00955, partial [Candidatus Pacearchaeota archaeon]